MLLQHRDIPAGQIHGPFNWIVADQAARDALAPAAGDVNKTLFQQDAKAVYVLLSVGPVVWQQTSIRGEAGVLATVLAGLSLVSSAAVSAADSILSAIGKLQAQITGHVSSTANPHGVSKAQVGLGNVDNTADVDKPISTAQAAGLVARTSATGAAKIPVGTTAQRDAAPVAGMVRLNQTLNQFEGHNGSSWGALGGGATGAPGNAAFYENDQAVTADYTITTGKNAMTAGPITINTGVTVTVPTGSVWSIV